VLDALRDWMVEVGRSPFAYEWSPGGSRAAGRSSRVWERWAREYPRWPEARTVAHYHRTWAALLVAGLAGGREPLELSLNERVEAARRMAVAGFSAVQIGEELGVRAGTVGGYLRAHTCRCGRNWVVKATRCGRCAREQAALLAPARWDRAGVIDALNRWTEVEGRTPSSEQWLGGRNARGRWALEYPEWPATATVVRLFGSWNRALEAAGLPVKPYAFTDGEVLEALRADAARLGRAPTREEWSHRPLGMPGVGAIQTHFGSWNAGLRAAGLEVNKENGKWTRELAIAALCRDAKRRGRSPTSQQWSAARRSRPHSATVEKLFGSWNAGLRAAGLRPNVERDKWTAAIVLEALRGLAQELGRQPTTRDLHRPPAGYPNRAIVRRKLGSWSAACRQLGWSCEQRVIATDEQMISALQTAGRELGAEFTHEDYKQVSGARGWPSANAITARFGSWNEPRQLAGLPVSRRLERGWAPEQLARALRAAARRIGRTPLAREWDDLASEYGWPSSATVMRRLGSGSWVAAIEAAGLTRRHTRLTPETSARPRSP
jgi:Homing endonuclease associated repeat